MGQDEGYKALRAHEKHNRLEREFQLYKVVETFTAISEARAEGEKARAAAIAAVSLWNKGNIDIYPHVKLDHAKK